MKLEDIARESGVSPTTVSFVINGKADRYKISAATREKIAAVVKRHDYVPNLFARAMQTHRTYLVGLLVPGNINRSYWMDILAGLEDVLSAERYHLLLAVSHFNPEDELESLKQMHSKGIDGYLICPLVTPDGAVASEKFLRKIARNKPVISLARPHHHLPSIFNDEERGGQLAADYLHAEGHRRAAYLGLVGAPHDVRGRAFAERFRALGGVVACFEDTETCLAAADGFTAVFCYSDYFVLDLYTRAVGLGLRFPDDLSVVGYDNMDFLDFLNPRPVSVRPNKRELGAAAGEMMLAALNGEAIANRVFEPDLAAGGSVRGLALT